jgi:hypothetical protein
VDVGSEARVIGEVVAGIVGIFVKDDVVAVPEPIVDKAYIRRSNAEVITIEPEAIWTASFKAPHVARTKFAGEMPVLPGTIKMVARIVPAFIVADPAIVVGVNVRSIGVSGMVIEPTIVRLPIFRLRLFRGMLLRNITRGCVSGRRRAMGRDVATANFLTSASTLIAATLIASTLTFASSLRDGKGGDCYECNEKSDGFLHAETLPEKFTDTSARILVKSCEGHRGNRRQATGMKVTGNRLQLTAEASAAQGS